MKGEKREIFNSASVGPDKCTFCKIAKGEFPSYTVFEDETYIAFLDINPFSKGHTLVCPKAHGETVWDMKEAEIGGLFLLAARVSRAVVEATGAEGFRLLQNNGEAANQIVAHVHVHVIPVMMSHKGKPMDRIRLEGKEMEDTSAAIRKALARD